MRRSIITSGITVLLLLACAVAIYFWLPDKTRAGETSRIVRDLATVIAIVIGGSLAATKLQVFREFEPHLNITHEISCQEIGESYVHIGVTAVLHNTSKVKIDILNATFALQQIDPIEDEIIERMYPEMYDLITKEIGWPVLEQIGRAWEKNELIIEPGEKHRETQEFIVSRQTKYVLVYTYFYNSKYSTKSQNAEGWTATSFCDIIAKSTS